MRRIFLGICLIVLSSLSAYSQKTIQLERDGGVYRLSCLVNGAKMKMIFDTGASMVCLSKSMAEYLYENEYISDSDILGTGKTQVADGRIVDNLIINIQDIEISGMHLKDVRASVSENQKAPLLLGMSAIEKLGAVTISGDQLIINTHSPNTKYSSLSDDELTSVLSDAMNNSQYYTAIDAFSEYKKRFDLSSYSYYNLSYCYFSTEQYQLCINAVSEMNDNLVITDDDEIKGDFAFAFGIAGTSCERLNQFQQAIMWHEKSLSLYKELSDIKSVANEYSYIAYSYKELGNKFQAITNFKKSIEYRLMLMNKTEYDVFKGFVHDERLGREYFGLYLTTDDKREQDEFRVLSARCGYKLAQESCIRDGLKY